MAMFKYRQFLNETEETPQDVISPPVLSEASRVEVVLPPAISLPCPEDYRRRSIIATVICLPIGLIALRWSYKVHNRHEDNNKAGAMRAAGEAATWALIGIVTGVFFWAVVLVILVVELFLSL